MDYIEENVLASADRGQGVPERGSPRNGLPLVFSENRP
ncbi:Hypothetical protein AA314_07001 [Archangium gephyra]|uniref:Uncharacterized protein n=1 Tax=Archangium gephyra TaxID=48 RepID=A0AAC8QDT9_9BACT|nr:Hypothetical protein AA314_07001 [Archangium gephyra]